MDGLFGALIIRDPEQDSYSEFTVLVNDWLHMDSNEFFSQAGVGPGGPDSAMYDRELSYFVFMVLAADVRQYRLRI